MERAHEGTTGVSSPDLRQVGTPPPPIILVVEDDADTRELYRTILDLEGYWVADAVDAVTAVSQAADLQPDLIITDLGLPGGCDGIQLAERLHQDPKTTHVPVLAVTGRVPAELPPELFSEVLQKPIPPDAFILAVHRALTRSRALRTRSALARERVPELLRRSERLLRKSSRLMHGLPERRRDDDNT